MKALGRNGNLFIIIDEFDGNHHQSAMFPSDLKTSNNTAYVSFFLSMLSVLVSFEELVPTL